MATREEIDISKRVANDIRKDIIDITFGLGNVGTHLGGSLSMAEMLATLYMCRISFDNDDPKWDGRDRVILSKGHGVLAQYSAMAHRGIISRDRLSEFKINGSDLTGHPSLHGLPGIEYATGSLGQGLSLAVGGALALKAKNNDARHVVFLGDGECNEGSVWEAAASASHFGLDNIIVVVDMNTIQYDGFTEEVMSYKSMSDKWSSFGWNVIEVDGHDVEQLLDAYETSGSNPLVILAHTVKGKGISFMENDWHYHNARLSKQQYETAKAELEAVV